MNILKIQRRFSVIKPGTESATEPSSANHIYNNNNNNKHLLWTSPRVTHVKENCTSTVRRKLGSISDKLGMIRSPQLNRIKCDDSHNIIQILYPARVSQITKNNCLIACKGLTIFSEIFVQQSR